jgi:ribosomal protein L2
MAATTVSSALYTAELASPKRSGNLDAGGRERVKIVPIIPGAVESGSTINICQIPVGAIVTGVEAHCEANAASSTLAVSVGAVDVVAATSIAAAAVLHGNLQAIKAVPTAAVTLVKATTGGATLTANKSMVFVVRYVLD